MNLLQREYIERRNSQPLYTLPRHGRRRTKRLEQIIAVRRSGETPSTPWILWLRGWTTTRPAQEEQYLCVHWMSKRYSVRGVPLTFLMWKRYKPLRAPSIDTVLRR